jgi:hypothetical protein
MDALPLPRTQCSLEVAHATVAAWRAGGLKPGVFCQQQGIPLSRLSSYRQRVSRAAESSAAPGGGFIALGCAGVAAGDAGRGLAIEVGDGVRVVGCGADQVVAILRGLGAVVRIGGGQ